MATLEARFGIVIFEGSERECQTVKNLIETLALYLSDNNFIAFYDREKNDLKCQAYFDAELKIKQ